MNNKKEKKGFDLFDRSNPKINFIRALSFTIALISLYIIIMIVLLLNNSSTASIISLIFGALGVIGGLLPWVVIEFNGWRKSRNNSDL